MFDRKWSVAGGGPGMVVLPTVATQEYAPDPEPVASMIADRANTVSIRFRRMKHPCAALPRGRQWVAPGVAMGINSGASGPLCCDNRVFIDSDRIAVSG